MESRQLDVLGGLFETRAPVLIARTKDEVLAAFVQARAAGHRLTIAGARRSLGEQYLPVSGALLLDVSDLDRSAQIVDRGSQGRIWVRAGGGTTFKDLRTWLPGYATHCPPTTDTITLAGALAACTHNSGGYFPDSIRAFSLLTPTGERYECRPGAPGLSGRLFEHVPGSFGALGVVTDIELELRPLDPRQVVLVHALYAGPSDSAAFLTCLERAADEPRFLWGSGAIVYGNRGHAIVLGDELMEPGHPHAGPRALLTDDAVGQQAITQALVNRFPRLAEWLVTRAYPQGVARWAPWYGFQFFQRGYDEAHRRMSRRSWEQTALRCLGVRERMPLCHMSWFFPRSSLRAMMDGYFTVMSRHPGVERAAEQQDLVLLGPSRWPLHSMGRTQEPIGVLTASFSVARGGSSHQRVTAFLREVTRETRQFAPQARVSLCKQIHADESDLARMHAEFIRTVRELRQLVDPAGLLCSRFLARLGLV